jgi:hypothetical protein
MSEKPILFSAAMVIALLDGRKTQTRRIVKLPHNNPLGQWEPTTIGGENGGRTADGKTVPLQGGIWHTRTGECLMSPYQPDDRLWVRETHSIRVRPEETTDGMGRVWYQATMQGDPHIRWKPSIHMPRWASRITLEVTGVRVERLQEISEADARAEGIDPLSMFNWRPDEVWSTNPQAQRYAELWNDLNTARGYGWDVNPWVWVVEFRRANV